MKITIKAARYYFRTYLSRSLILDSLIKQLHLVNHKVVKRALKVLECPKERCDSHIFDPLHRICSIEERRMLQTCINSGYRERIVRHSLTFTVQPTLTIGALKSLLKPEPWIPKENLVLIQYRPLEDDDATLAERLVEDQDSLFACMDGSFPLIVQDVHCGEEFVIPISSCCETVGELKMKIFEKKFYFPLCQSLKYQKKLVSKKNETSLVALGIVRDVPEDSRRVELHLS